MDVELIPGLLRFTITKENVNVTMKFEVLKRHVLRPALSTDMIQRDLRWERHKMCSSKKKKKKKKSKGLWQRNGVIIFYNILLFSHGKEKMKRREENGQNYIVFFNSALFGHILNNHQIHFLMHSHSSWSTFSLHLVRGPKTL
jgi:hypothetical protein